jgi:hypothetical protein
MPDHKHVQWWQVEVRIHLISVPLEWKSRNYVNVSNSYLLLAKKTYHRTPQVPLHQNLSS